MGLGIPHGRKERELSLRKKVMLLRRALPVWRLWRCQLHLDVTPDALYLLDTDGTCGTPQLSIVKPGLVS